MNKLSFKNSFMFVLVSAITVGGFLSFTNTTFAADTTAPVIKILGSNPMNLKAGDKFVDPGATSFDAVDGNLTKEISKQFVDSPVDINIAGTYPYSYTSCDNSSNCATAIRKVIVTGTFSGGGQILGVDKFNFTARLAVGSQGSEVVELQKFLNANGFDCGLADGQFGPKTKNAVMAFQQANSLMADGIIGPISRAILNK